MTRRTIIDWSGKAEPRLIHKKARFTLELVPIPTTNDRQNPRWIAILTVGEAAHA
jgi:hypothetical protein